MNFAEIMEMLRNPQAMQARMTELREKTEKIQATGSSGGGMVRVTLNGGLEMLSCEIAPEIVAKDGDRFTVGKTTVTAFETPGHTFGTASFSFQVRDGRAHGSF